MEHDILIVLSEEDQPEAVCALLSRNGLTAKAVENVRKAVQSLKTHINTFLLLDLSLEGAPEFLAGLMGHVFPPPPYLLAADLFSGSGERTAALNLGADACLEKPVDVEEVLALVHAALRRAEQTGWTDRMNVNLRIEHEKLAIEPQQRRVTMSGALVELTVTEFDILHLLAQYPGIVFSKAQIYERVWNEDGSIASSRVADHISSLRQKLGIGPKDQHYIQTVHGVGYRFASPVET